MENRTYRAAVAQAKKLYYSSLISNASDSKTLWKTVNGLLHRTFQPSYPSQPVESLPDQFASSFSEKENNLRSSIPISSNTSPHIPKPIFPAENLSDFASATVEEIIRLVLDSKDK